MLDNKIIFLRKQFSIIYSQAVFISDEQNIHDRNKAFFHLKSLVKATLKRGGNYNQNMRQYKNND